MNARGVSSGSPALDRRLEFAEGLAGDGALAAAREVLGGALEEAPGWAAGWYRLGEWCAAAGDVAAAAAAWDRAVLADPSDRLGAGLKRDLVRRVPVAEQAPPAFVEALFDEYAPRFETSLVDRLEYRAPDLLARALEGQGRFGRALDLGCGTGLAGLAFRDRCDWLGGCDISAGMLAEARAKRVYDRLEKQDLSALQPGSERYDLILAADVFIYLGALERIIGWCAGALAPGGWLAFTVEAIDEAGETSPWLLRDSRRFAHSAAYVAGLLAEAGLGGATLRPAVLRKDRGRDVAGYVVTARLGVTAPMRRAGEGDAVPA